MATKMGFSYANLLVDNIEKRIFGGFIDDYFNTASCPGADLERFISFVDDFHPALKFTCKISETYVPLLDILLHPYHNKTPIRYSQFLRLRHLCSHDQDFETKSLELRSSFVQRGYPSNLLDTGIQKAFNVFRSDSLKPPSEQLSTEKVPLLVTFHPFN